MPRALSIQRTVVPADDRFGFLEQARRREAHFQGAGCQYWMFEDAQASGEFVEFAEARDAATLAAAHAGLVRVGGVPSPIYVQVQWPA